MRGLIKQQTWEGGKKRTSVKRINVKVGEKFFRGFGCCRWGERKVLGGGFLKRYPSEKKKKKKKSPGSGVSPLYQLGEKDANRQYVNRGGGGGKLMLGGRQQGSKFTK